MVHKRVVSKKANVPESLFLPLSHCAGFREAVVVNHNQCSILQRGDQITKYGNAVPVRPIVEDPTEQIHVCILDGLLGEEIVGHELYAVRKTGREVGGATLDDFG